MYSYIRTEGRRGVTAAHREERLGSVDIFGKKKISVMT
jgi:hypothetical protein